MEAGDVKQETIGSEETNIKEENYIAGVPFHNSDDSKEWITQNLVPLLEEVKPFTSDLKTEPCALENNNIASNLPSDSDLRSEPEDIKVIKNEVNDKAVDNEELQNRTPLCTVTGEIPGKSDASFDERLIKLTKSAPNVSESSGNSLNKGITEIADSTLDSLSTVSNNSNLEEISSKRIGQEGNNDNESVPDKTKSLPFSPPNHVDSIFCQCFGCRRKFRKRPMYYGYKYPCTVCSRKFNRSAKLKEHIETKCNQIKLFSCSYCAKGFNSKNSLKGHISTCGCSDNKVRSEFNCDICNKTYVSSLGLKSHKKRAHTGAGELKVPQTCDVCKKVYSSFKSLRSHTKRYHSHEEFECGHCGKIYNSKGRLTTHVQEKHMTGLFCFKCDQCNKRYKEESRLEDHKVRQHSTDAEDKLPFICEFCGKAFKKKVQLKVHLLMHGEKSVVCNVCGKCFRTKSNLDQHSWTHSNVRPFVCDLCGKSFKIRNHLRQHMAVHGMVNTSWRGKRKRKDMMSSHREGRKV